MNIKCPNCKELFLLDSALDAEKTSELRKQFDAETDLKIEAERKKMREIMLEHEEKRKAALLEEKQKLQQEAEQNKALLLDKLNAENAVKIQFLQDAKLQAEAQLKIAQAKELELLKAQQDLENFKAQAEIENQKLLMEAEKIFQQKLQAEILPNAMQAYELKLKEKDLQMESMKKNLDEMNRKVEQGSMQTQGEAQEVLLENLLSGTFVFDAIQEVGKGVKGADCIQTVFNAKGEECGKIMFESKRTKNWENDWLEKLKVDARNNLIDVSIIVSQAMPKGITNFGQKDGIWICSYQHIIGLVTAIRQGIIAVYEAKKSQENKGDKMVMLYDYLTGNEFYQYLEAIVEGFTSLKMGITKEKMAMDKIWAEREKQIDKTLINAARMYGGIKGIAGNSIGSISVLELGS